MTFATLRNDLKPICNTAGLILVIAAALRLAGLRFGINADVTDLALIGIGLLHV